MTCLIFVFSHSFQEFGLPFLLATVWYLPTFWQLCGSFPQWWLRCTTWRNDQTAFGESQRRGSNLAKGWMKLITPAGWRFTFLFLVLDWKSHEIEDCLEKIGCDIVCSNHGNQDHGFCFSWVLHNVHSDTGNPVETPRLPRIWLKKQMDVIGQCNFQALTLSKMFCNLQQFFDILWEAFFTLPLDGHVQPWISRQLFCLLGLSYNISHDGTFPYVRFGMYDNLCFCISECFVGSLTTTTTKNWQWNA